MITLFAVPKPMRGEFARLQENAVGSWRALGAGVEILLLGDEDGIAGLAEQHRARHIRDVARTEFGTPRVDDIFRIGGSEARNELIGYINADILLTGDFLRAISVVANLKRRFLLIGRRWDLDFADPIDFGSAAWEREIRSLTEAKGSLHAESGIDYFIYPRGLWDGIPPFAIGRTMWDNWLIWKARASGAMVIDATGSLTAIHQNHGYNHHPRGAEGVWKGPEALRNEELAGGLARYFTIADATHRLADGKIRRWRDGSHIRRYWMTLPAIWKPAGWWKSLRAGFLRWIYHLRVTIARMRGRVK